MAWVYILQCADGSYYTGMTRGEEPDQRLSEHLMKLSPGAYTASRLPVKLVYSEYFDLIADAIFARLRMILAFPISSAALFSSPRSCSSGLPR